MPSSKKRLIGYLEDFLYKQVETWMKKSKIGGSETVTNGVNLLVSVEPEQYKKLQKTAFKNNRSVYGEATAIYVEAIENRINKLEEDDEI